MFKKSPASHVNRIAPPPTHFIVTRRASVEARTPAGPPFRLFTKIPEVRTYLKFLPLAAASSASLISLVI